MSQKSDDDIALLEKVSGAVSGRIASNRSMIMIPPPEEPKHAYYSEEAVAVSRPAAPPPTLRWDQTSDGSGRETASVKYQEIFFSAYPDGRLHVSGVIVPGWLPTGGSTIEDAKLAAEVWLAQRNREAQPTVSSDAHKALMEQSDKRLEASQKSLRVQKEWLERFREKNPSTSAALMEQMTEFVGSAGFPALVDTLRKAARTQLDGKNVTKEAAPNSKLFVGGDCKKLLGEIVANLAKNGTARLTEKEQSEYADSLTDENLTMGAAAMKVALKALLARLWTPAVVEEGPR